MNLIIFLYINLDNRFVNCNRSICTLSVNGVDFWICEPFHFSSTWYSYKIHDSSVCYKIGICIQTGWIAWANSLYSCSPWTDLVTFRHSLMHLLLPGKWCIADSGYRDAYGVALTPTGHHDFVDRQRATVRARH